MINKEYSVCVVLRSEMLTQICAFLLLLLVVAFFFDEYIQICKNV